MTKSEGEAVSQGPATIAFEQPLNERVRMFLRLEFLFAEFRHHRADSSAWGLRASLHALLDLLSLLGRSDLKTEIIKELGDQQSALTRLKQKPGVDPGRLDQVLGEILAAINAMQRLTTHAIATALRDNEFLMTLANRSTVPGGTAGFDLPHFHAWLALPAAQQHRDLDAWFADLAPFEQCVNLYLKLLRNSVEPTPQVARGGMFVYTPQAQYALVRVLLPADSALYPEISAGRHRFTVRMMQLRDVNVRAHQATHDVSFHLQCCLL